MTHSPSAAARKRLALLPWLVGLLVACVFPAALRADALEDFGYSVKNKKITIDSYFGSGGTVVIPAKIGGLPVTSIGDKAFADCSELTSVSIPASVTSITDGAFSGCNGLTSLTIPASVTSIGKSAFYGCYRLTSLSIPSGVTSIGDGAFANCSGLTSISIPSGVTSISDGAFSGCNGLTSLSIPANITSIGGAAFADCSNLNSVSIPSTVTSIGNGAFRSCSKLTSISIPAGVTLIGYQAFYSCNELTSVSIPSSVTSIGDSAFQYCSKLTSIVIPSSVTSTGNSTFQYCDALTSVSLTYGVTSIGNYAFLGCSKLTSLSIPASITSIGGNAFSGCSGLTSVSIPSTVTLIGSNAFAGCSALTSVSIPVGVTSIGDGAFASCSGLNGISIPHSITSIGNYAFQYCSALTSIFIPSGVSSIGIGAFANCSGLTSVSISSGVSSIGIGMFSGCYGLTAVALPASITSIGDRAFQYCYGLTGISIPESVTSIGIGAFSDCPRLTSVSIPASVTSIGASAFSRCSGLTSISIPESVKFIRYSTFSGCSGLTSVSIPSTITLIDSNAFAGCSGLTSVSIPAGVTSIADYAFYGCSGLTNISIPASVTSIELGAFSNCSNLSGATFLGNAPLLWPLVFDATAPGFTIYFDPSKTGFTNPAWLRYRTRPVNGDSPQTITFASLTDRVFGQAPFTLSASASSGLPVNFSVTSGPATLSGSTLTLTGTGTVVISADQAGNFTYGIAPSVSSSFNVAASTLAITSDSPAVLTLGTADSVLLAGVDVATWSASGLPAWLSLNAQTGLLAGTAPSAATPFSFNLTATSTHGVSLTQPFLVVFTAPAAADFAFSSADFTEAVVGRTLAGLTFISSTTFINNAEPASSPLHSGTWTYARSVANQGSITLSYPNANPVIYEGLDILHRSALTTDALSYDLTSDGADSGFMLATANLHDLFTPRQFAAVPSGTREVGLSWTDEGWADGYKVYRNTSGTPPDDDDAPISGATALTTGSYTDSAPPRGATLYYWLTAVRSGQESAPVSTSILVRDVPLVLDQPTNVLAAVNSTQVFNVTTLGTGLKYQWFFAGKAIKGATSEDLSLKVTPKSAGTYTLKITDNTNDTAQALVTLRVALVPKITAQPAKSLALLIGGNGSLTAAASGEAVSYQWFRNGIALDGKTSPTLTFTNATSADAGSYTVRASNIAGSVLSKPATVTVR